MLSYFTVTVAYLIDGNNFLGFISPSNLKNPQSKYNLALKLQIFQHIKKTRIILAFDGYPDLNLMTKQFQEKKFLVLYPPPGQNADQIIKEIILKQNDLRRFFVVSSDHDIKSFAKAKGAKTLSCKEFDRQLGKVLKKYKAALEEEKKEFSPSPLEINQWLEMFKDKND